MGNVCHPTEKSSKEKSNFRHHKYKPAIASRPNSKMMEEMFCASEKDAAPGGWGSAASKYVQMDRKIKWPKKIRANTPKSVRLSDLLVDDSFIPLISYVLFIGLFRSLCLPVLILSDVE